MYGTGFRDDGNLVAMVTCSVAPVVILAVERKQVFIEKANFSQSLNRNKPMGRHYTVNCIWFRKVLSSSISGFVHRFSVFGGQVGFFEGLSTDLAFLVDSRPLP